MQLTFKAIFKLTTVIGDIQVTQIHRASERHIQKAQVFGQGFLFGALPTLIRAFDIPY